MIARNYRITAPYQFEVQVDLIEAQDNEAIVRTEAGAICKADLRYYTGQRERKNLGLKYPLCLLHEAAGTVVKDRTGKFKPGERVVPVPNVIDPESCANCSQKVCEDPALGENYCPAAKFASSSADGFSREYFTYPVDYLVKITHSVPTELAVMAELISVANAATRRLPLSGKEKVIVFGDGILGFILTSVLLFGGIEDITIVGGSEKRLANFPVPVKINYHTDPLPQPQFDLAFEAVGGGASEAAFESISQVLRPGGSCCLLGVAEEKIRINSRIILEKGLCFAGVTRSSRNDFVKAMNQLTDEKFASLIKSSIIAEAAVGDVVDFKNEFEYALSHKGFGKRVLRFNF